MMIINGPFTSKFANIINPKIKQVNLMDMAVVKMYDSTYGGKIKLINMRGINIGTDYGDKFAKWENVLSITKVDE